MRPRRRAHRPERRATLEVLEVRDVVQFVCSYDSMTDFFFSLIMSHNESQCISVNLTHCTAFLYSAIGDRRCATSYDDNCTYEVRICDFGLAQKVQMEQGAATFFGSRTMFGGVGGGTPQYMPPELIEGVGAAVPRDRAESSGSQGSSGSGSLGGNHSISSQRSYQSSDEENPNTGSRTTSTDFESGRGMHTLDLNVDGQREKMKADVYAFGIILWELITCEPVCVCALSFLSFFLSFPFLSFPFLSFPFPFLSFPFSYHHHRTHFLQLCVLLSPQSQISRLSVCVGDPHPGAWLAASTTAASAERVSA